MGGTSELQGAGASARGFTRLLQSPGQWEAVVWRARDFSGSLNLLRPLGGPGARDVTKARRKYGVCCAPPSVREGSWPQSSLGCVGKAARGRRRRLLRPTEGNAMGDEMDAMIPEREMKVRDWPGPPSLP